MPLIRRILAASLLLLPLTSIAAPCAGFDDVDSADAFCENVTWMKNRAITLGCDTSLYCPQAPVTRLQMAAFIARLGLLVERTTIHRGGDATSEPLRFGTTANQPVELLANGLRGLRLEREFVNGAGWVKVTLGGPTNEIAPDSFAASVLGGNQNTILGGDYATIAGGTENMAGGHASFVAGGGGNRTAGNYSFAAGYRAQALLRGCHVVADNSNVSDTSCFADNEFVARYLGGFYFWIGGTNDQNYSGSRLAPGAGAWAAYSDRNGKHAIEPVDVADVLDKVVAMPVATWAWKNEPGARRHMGPMAQDFHRAFGLGSSDREIVTVDADGVALAAIQGLNAKLEVQAREIAALRAQLARVLARADGTATVATRRAGED